MWFRFRLGLAAQDIGKVTETIAEIEQFTTAVDEINETVSTITTTVEEKAAATGEISTGSQQIKDSVTAFFKAC